MGGRGEEGRAQEILGAHIERKGQEDEHEQ